MMATSPRRTAEGDVDPESPNHGAGKPPIRTVLFGSYDSGRHERAQVLLEGLRAHDHQIVECNVPLGLNTEMRLRMLRRPVLVPLLLVRVLSCWVRLIPMSRRLPKPDVVVVAYLGQFDILLARLLWPRAAVVLDHSVPAAGVALDHDLRSRWRSVLLRMIDRVATTVADVVLVDTEEHLAQLPARRGRADMVFCTGAPAAYHRVTACPDGEPLRLLFCGTYGPLHGTAVIARAWALLDRRVDVQLTMIGDGPERARAQDLIGPDPRVRWVDWLPREALASELAQHHVCLGIFGETEKAARVVPTKLYQGAAAGCALVTGRSDAQARVFGSTALMVPRGDPQALADLILELVHHPDEVAAARQRALDLAEGFLPSATVAALHEELSRRRRDDRCPRRGRPAG